MVGIRDMTIAVAINDFARAVESETGERPESIVLTDKAFRMLMLEWRRATGSTGIPLADTAFCAGVRLFSPSLSVPVP